MITMTLSDFETDDLKQAVRAIWQECGYTAPEGDALSRAANNLRQALEMGRQIPRVADKTLQPMSATRNDIEAQG